MTTENAFGSAPKGLRGYIDNWKFDLVAGFSVALVALPLALGIAVASGVPPMAGMVSAIVGGLITTFIRGGHIAINGPANSLIVVTLSAVTLLSGQGGNTFGYIMAAFAISGVLQLLIGLFRLGNVAEFFPVSVINGLLAAIGFIILGKQVHVALGSGSDAQSTLGIIADIPNSILQANPVIVLISLISLVILIWHPRIKSKIIHFIPAPLIVLAIAIPLAILFKFQEGNVLSIPFLQQAFEVGPQYLVQLPDDLMEGLILPDFSILHKPVFWLVVVLITLVTTIETLVSAKAVDNLDPYKRNTNLNRDLLGVGISTVISAFVGGLPVTAVIVRSSVNVNHGARTRLSNFYHGLILLIILAFFASIIQYVPLSALAAILIFAGFRLMAPRVFRESYRKGSEQALILSVTMLATIASGLIPGIIIGVIFTLFIHYIRANIPFGIFWNYLFKPQIRIIDENDKDYYVRLKGVANFFTILRLIKRLEKDIPDGRHVILDFSNATVVDYTVLEYVYKYAQKYNRREEGRFEVTGLDVHETSSDHPYALHTLVRHRFKKVRLSERQQELKAMAEENGWGFSPAIDWDVSVIRTFQFFDKRPVEYRNNIITGHYEDGMKWEVCDITFDEGALLATEVYHATIQVIRLPFKIPPFTLDEEGFFDRIIAFAGHDDVDFERYPGFSNKFLLRGLDEREIRAFFTEDIIGFLEHNEIYHMESKNNRLCIFKYTRLAGVAEIRKMTSFAEELVHILEQKYMVEK